MKTNPEGEVMRNRIALSTRILWLSVLAAALLLLPSSASAQSATVTDDAFASSSSATQSLNLNGQGISLLVAGSNATVGSAHLGATKTFIRFQLQSSLPPGVSAANVSKATLKLFVSTGVAPTGTIDLYPVTGDWSEATLNPASPPAISSTPFATGIPVGKSNSFLVVDVTQLVQEWLNGPAKGGMENHGIALVASTSTSYVVFDSKEGIVTSHEPRLEIALASSGPQGPAGPQGPQGLAGPQGATGSSGSPGAPGAAASVQVGNTVTVAAGTPASVLNGGTQNAAVLNFLIPQGPAGTPGAQGLQGPVGINNRGAWNATNDYRVNDAVSDQGSFWLAVQPIPANTPNSEPSSTNTSWQLLAAQGAAGAPGSPGSQGPKGDQGPMGLQGLQGPSGQNPVGAALTTTPNTFAGNQTINGNLILAGGGGVQFADGTVQTSAASAGSGGGIPTGFMITGTTPVAPPGYTLSGSFSAGNLWAPMAPMPTAPRGFAAAAVNGKIYAIGGYDPSNRNASLSTVEVYDPATNTWRSSTEPPGTPGAPAPMPTARGFLAAAAVNGKIYAIGGDDGNIVNTVEVYDPATNTWRSSTEPPGTPGAPAPMPTAQFKLAAAAVNGKIYAIGGVAGNALQTVEVYDPSSNSWSTAAGMLTARYGLAAADANGLIYAVGGENLSGVSTEQYSPPRTIYTFIKN